MIMFVKFQNLKIPIMRLMVVQHQYHFLLLRLLQICSKISTRGKNRIKRVFNAMASHPLLVGSTDNFDSSFIQALDGKGITKVGGES